MKQELDTPDLIQVIWRDCETYDGWIDIVSLLEARVVTSGLRK